MKIAFSTLGCQSCDWEKIVLLAKSAAYDAIEINGIGGESYAPHIRQFLPEHSAETKKRLAETGLEISCLTAGACLSESESRERDIALIRDYIDLAARLGAPYVRISCDSHRRPETDVDLDLLIDSFTVLSRYAATSQVMLLIGTNGAFSDSRLLLDLLRILNMPQIGVCWDIHHPYRFCLESVRETYATLKKHIKYVHIKDSRLYQLEEEYCQAGEGDIPIKEALFLLKKNNFTGYVSTEWESAWHNNFGAPELVIPRFIDYVRRTIK